MDTRFLYACRVWMLCGIASALLVLTTPLTPALAGPGDISTVAGGYIGDGGPALQARINSPSRVAVDAAGNVYIMDTYNQRVRKVLASDQTITTVAGNGISAFAGDGILATAASINEANGVAVDAAGNIYIADSFNQRIRKVTAGSNVITTITGTGGLGYGGYNLEETATEALLNYPYSVATTTGKIFIADANNNRIRRVDLAAGTISTVAGSGTPTYDDGGGNVPGSAWFASLNYPTDVAVDAAGNIYIADSNNHRIRKVTFPDYIISTVAGNGTAGYTGDNAPAIDASLNAPFGVAVDAAGNIFIADKYNNVIRKVDTLGTITTVAGNGLYDYSGNGGPATGAGMRYPTGVALDAAGNIYIADQNNDCIRKVTASTGNISTIAGSPENALYGNNGPATAASLNYPHGVGVDGSGNVYIADTKNMMVRKVTSAGVISVLAGNGIQGSSGIPGPATAASLNNPYGVAADGLGNVYIADSYNNSIRKVNASGSIDTVAGDGTPAVLNGPRGVAVDAAGNLYIADTDNHRVRKVTYPAGTISTIAGTGTGTFNGDSIPATTAALNAPTAVALDAAGNIYIADSGNNRIRKITYPAGTITTVAGTGTYGYSGDGGPAAEANLATPYGVAVDPAGTIYIADFYNSKIRKVVSGTISTVAGNGIPDVNIGVYLGFAGDGEQAAPAGYSILNNSYSVAVDPAGNVYFTDVNNWRVRMVATTLPPALSSVHIASSNTNNERAKTGDTVTLTITASQMITAPTVTIAGRAAAVTGGGTSWSASIVMNGTDVQGMVSISITYKSLAGISGPEVHSVTDSSSVTFDRTAPTVAIGAPSASAVKSGATVTYTVTYTGADSVTLASAALNATGTATGTVAISGTGTASRTVTISGITGNGTLGISITAGTASDLAGNTAAAAGPSATFNVDNTAPTLVVSGPSSTLTNTGPVTYTVTYTGADAVTLANANITLNATGGATGTVAISGTGTASRTVTISGITGNGTLGISIAAGTASDLAGNTAAAAGPSATFNVDNTAPTLVVSGPSSTLTNTGPVTCTVTYTGADSVTLANATLNATGTATGTVAISGTGTASRTVTISGITGNGTLGISIAAGTASDLAGNTAAAAGPSAIFNVDNTAPTLAIGAPSASAVKSGTTVTYTVTYTGADSVTLANATLNATGTATGTVAISGTGTLTRIVTISGITGDGTLGISIEAATAGDLAGNTAAAAGPSATFVVDNTAPTLVVSGPSSTLTNTGPVTYTVAYTGADSVTLENTDIILNATGTATGTVAISGTGTASRTVTISGITGNGTLGISIEAATAGDLAGNTAAAAGPSATFVVDNTAPTLVVSGPSSTLTNTGPVTYTVTYTGADSVTLANATLNATGTANGTVAISGTGTASRTVTISGITGNGTLGISIAAGTASDLAGNTAAAAGPSATFVVDNTAPTVAISAPSASAANTGPVTYTVTYTGADSVTLASAALNATGTATGTVAISGTGTASRTVTISGITGNGTLGISIEAATASDLAGNTAAAAGPSSTFIVDNIAPTATISSTALDPTNTSPIPVTVTFSEAVTGFTSGEVVANNGTVGAFSGSGTTYTFSVTPSGNGTVTIDVAAGVAQDAAGNGNTAALQLSRTFDSVNPTVTISTTAPDPTNTSPIPVTVTFSKAVTGFVSGDVTIGNGSISLFTAVNGTTYTFNVTPALNGAVTVNVAAGVALDGAANANLAAVPLTRTFDTAGPTAVISSSVSSPTNALPIPFTVTFSEAVTGFTSGDVTVGNGAIGLFTAVSGTTYTFSVTPAADGTVTVDVAAAAGQDAAGNGNSAAAQLSRTYDSGQPTVTISSLASDWTRTSPIPVTVTFSEAVTGFISSDVGVTNGSISGFTVSGPTSYSFNVTPSANGPVTIDVAGSVAQDAAGNVNSAALQLSKTYDTVAPTVAIGSPSLTEADNGVSVTYTVTYAGANAVNLAPSHVSLNTTGTANGSIAVTGAGTASRTITISNITGFDGTLGITIAANTASDLAGNSAAGTGPSATFSVDNASGDLNGGGLDISDALKALRIAAGLDAPTASDLAHGDVAPLLGGARQPDGKINIADVIAILRKYVGLPSW